MANHIVADQTKQITRDLVRYSRTIQDGADGLTRVLAAMTQASDGARDAAGDFDLLATIGGFSAGDYSTANDAAKAAYDEANSVVGTYNANLKAAVDQLVAYLGVT